MATIQQRGNSYLIRVSCGYDSKGKQIIQSMMWKPDEKMTPKQVEKELNRQAVMFEEACMHGFQSKAIKFVELAEEWFEESRRVKFSFLSTVWRKTARTSVPGNRLRRKRYGTI